MAGKDFIFLVENFPKFELKGLGEKPSNIECLEMFGNYYGDGVCIYIYILYVYTYIDYVCINAN